MRVQGTLKLQMHLHMILSEYEAEQCGGNRRISCQKTSVCLVLSCVS